MHVLCIHRCTAYIYILMHLAHIAYVCLYVLSIYIHRRTFKKSYGFGDFEPRQDFGYYNAINEGRRCPARPPSDRQRAWGVRILARAWLQRRVRLFRVRLPHPPRSPPLPLRPPLPDPCNSPPSLPATLSDPHPHPSQRQQECLKIIENNDNHKKSCELSN